MIYSRKFIFHLPFFRCCCAVSLVRWNESQFRWQRQLGLPLGREWQRSTTKNMTKPESFAFKENRVLISFLLLFSYSRFFFSFIALKNVCSTLRLWTRSTVPHTALAVGIMPDIFTILGYVLCRHFDHRWWRQRAKPGRRGKSQLAVENVARKTFFAFGDCHCTFAFIKIIYFVYVLRTHSPLRCCKRCTCLIHFVSCRHRHTDAHRIYCLCTLCNWTKFLIFARSLLGTRIQEHEIDVPLGATLPRALYVCLYALYPHSSPNNGYKEKKKKSGKYIWKAKRARRINANILPKRPSEQRERDMTGAWEFSILLLLYCVYISECKLWMASRSCLFGFLLFKHTRK